ncbi:MAG: molybdotransferase-like divisome protein Glp [Actinomycetes bacterium]
MKSVEAHIADVLAGVRPLDPLDLSLQDAHGCALAEEVVAPWDLPPFDNASMDGYAVRVDDLKGAAEDRPVSLPVVGDIAAGSSTVSTIQAGLTARIMTGAPVPTGTEAVVPVEWTDGGVATVSVRQVPEPGQHIRRHGEDVKKGDVVLTSGMRLGPAQIGLLAAVGRDRVHVRPRPRVVVLSTGSELVEPGVPIAGGQISDSNSYMLTAAAKETGALVYRIGIVRDDARTLLATLEDQLIRADLVVTSGGVSAGAYDVVKEVLTRLGTVKFEQVAMQPGKPQGHGTIGPDSTPILTLPGNPVSAYVSFEVFVRPVLRCMFGVEPLHRPVVRAVCTHELTSVPGKRQYLRATLEREEGGFTVSQVGGPGSHLMGDLALANALIVLGEDVTGLPTGSEVDVMVLERRQS